MNVEQGLAYDSSFIIPHSSFLLSVSADEPLDVGVLGLVQRLVRALEDDLAAAQHQHLRVDEAEALALLLEGDLAVVVDDRVLRGQVLDVVHLVRDEDRGDVLEVAQLDRQLADGARGRRVQSRRRLVEHDDLRAADERPRDSDAPPHAPRELDRHLVDGVLEVDEAEHAADLLLDLLLGHALLVQAVGDVVVDRTKVEERALLEDHADLLPDAHHLGLRVFGDVLAVYEDAARVGLQEAEDELDGRGLAAARAAEDDLGLTPAHLEAETVEDDAVVEREGHVPELDGRDDALAVVHLGECRLGGGLAHPALDFALRVSLSNLNVRGRHKRYCRPSPNSASLG